MLFNCWLLVRAMSVHLISLIWECYSCSFVPTWFDIDSKNLVFDAGCVSIFIHNLPRKVQKGGKVSEKMEKIFQLSHQWWCKRPNDDGKTSDLPCGKFWSFWCSHKRGPPKLSEVPAQLVDLVFSLLFLAIHQTQCLPHAPLLCGNLRCNCIHVSYCQSNNTHCVDWIVGLVKGWFNWILPAKGLSPPKNCLNIFSGFSW